MPNSRKVSLVSVPLTVFPPVHQDGTATGVSPVFDDAGEDRRTGPAP